MVEGGFEPKVSSPGVNVLNHPFNYLPSGRSFELLRVPGSTVSSEPRA